MSTRLEGYREMAAHYKAMSSPRGVVPITSQEFKDVSEIITDLLDRLAVIEKALEFYPPTFEQAQEALKEIRK